MHVATFNFCGVLAFLFAPSASRAAALATPAGAGLNIPFKLAPLPELRNKSSLAKDQRRQIYVVPVSVASETFELIMDTGSSELWVDTSVLPPPNLAAFTSVVEDTGVPIELNYGLNGSATSASGVAQLADVHLGGIAVRGQAFVNVPGAPEITQYGDQGILGLGAPRQWSVVQDALSGTKQNGRTFLHNTFRQHPTLGNVFAVGFGERDARGVVQDGTLSIGEVLPSFTKVQNMPKLPLVTGRFWDVPSSGFLVDGVPLDVESSVSPNQGMILDTGAFAACVLPEYLRAIYTSVPGSYLLEDGSWSVPCDATMNVSVIFGDVPYLIHPLDMTEVYDVRDGKALCRSLFQPNTELRIPFLVGLNVLRNTYLLYNYGNPAVPISADPYVQVLSTVDVEKAFEEFDAMNRARIEAFMAKKETASAPSSLSTLEENVVGTLGVPSLSHWNSFRGLAGVVFAGAACLAVVLSIFRCRGYLSWNKTDP